MGVGVRVRVAVKVCVGVADGAGIVKVAVFNGRDGATDGCSAIPAWLQPARMMVMSARGMTGGRIINHKIPDNIYI